MIFLLEILKSYVYIYIHIIIHIIIMFIKFIIS